MSKLHTKRIVLDLDHTLIHCVPVNIDKIAAHVQGYDLDQLQSPYRPINEPDVTYFHLDGIDSKYLRSISRVIHVQKNDCHINIQSDIKPLIVRQWYKIHIRQGVIEFLANASQDHSLMIYTFASRRYAQPIINEINYRLKAFLDIQHEIIPTWLVVCRQDHDEACKKNKHSPNLVKSLMVLNMILTKRLGYETPLIHLDEEYMSIENCWIFDDRMDVWHPICWQRLIIVPIYEYKNSAIDDLWNHWVKWLDEQRVIESLKVFRHEDHCKSSLMEGCVIALPYDIVDHHVQPMFASVSYLLAAISIHGGTGFVDHGSQLAYTLDHSVVEPTQFSMNRAKGLKNGVTHRIWFDLNDEHGRIVQQLPQLDQKIKETLTHISILYQSLFFWRVLMRLPRCEFLNPRYDLTFRATNWDSSILLNPDDNPMLLIHRKQLRKTIIQMCINPTQTPKTSFKRSNFLVNCLITIDEIKKSNDRLSSYKKICRENIISFAVDEKNETHGCIARIKTAWKTFSLNHLIVASTVYVSPDVIPNFIIIRSNDSLKQNTNQRIDQQ